MKTILRIEVLKRWPLMACLALWAALFAGGAMAGGAGATADGATNGSSAQSSVVSAQSSVVDTADYRIGPGDLLRVNVFGYPDLAGDVRVSQTGNITFPLIGAVPVAGLSPREVETQLSHDLASGHYIKRSQVTVLVVEYQSHRVAVMGEVAKPGQYPLVGTRRVLNLLADAGGVTTATAGYRAMLIHADGTRIPLDLVAMMNGDQSDNPIVQPDDVIDVPKAAQFYIYGEVQKPGVYRLERNMTIDEAISAGGGLTRRGTEHGLIVKRHEHDQEFKVRVKGSDLLRPDDVVMVKQSWF
jgi:polysaccharide export outer membrane protein